MAKSKTLQRKAAKATKATKKSTTGKATAIKIPRTPRTPRSRNGSKGKRTILTITHVGWSVGDKILPSKAKAVKYARAEARKIEKAGGLAQVLVKNRNGRIETEWSYGEDPIRHKG